MVKIFVFRLEVEEKKLWIVGLYIEFGERFLD